MLNLVARLRRRTRLRGLALCADFGFGVAGLALILVGLLRGLSEGLGADVCVGEGGGGGVGGFAIHEEAIGATWLLHSSLHRPSHIPANLLIPILRPFIATKSFL